MLWNCAINFTFVTSLTLRHPIRGNWTVAYRSSFIPLTHNHKLRAFALIARGCIKVKSCLWVICDRRCFFISCATVNGFGPNMIIRTEWNLCDYESWKVLLRYPPWGGILKNWMLTAEQQVLWAWNSNFETMGSISIGNANCVCLKLWRPVRAPFAETNGVYLSSVYPFHQTNNHIS